MDFKIDSIIPFNTIKSDPDSIFSIVEKNGKVVLLKDNQPVYIIIKYDALEDFEDNGSNKGEDHYKLHDAMKVVLLKVKGNTMHASKLADEIYERRLYLQKNGNKAQYNQIRARCSHYQDMFEVLPGNFIKLRDGAE